MSKKAITKKSSPILRNFPIYFEGKQIGEGVINLETGMINSMIVPPEPIKKLEINFQITITKKGTLIEPLSVKEVAVSSLTNKNKKVITKFKERFKPKKN